jgi:ADP-heptose:LPS heptosyltransferase
MSLSRREDCSERPTARGRRTALVLHMNAIGEALFSLPLLHGLRHATPPWRVISVVRGGAGELIAASGLADRALFRIPALGPRHHLDLIRSVRAAHPEVSLALTTSRSSSILAWLSGAPRRVGYRQADFAFLHTTTIASEGSGLDNFLRLLDAAGIERTTDSYCGLLRAPAEAQSRATDLLRQAGCEPGKPFVALSPISSGKTGLKAYPAEHWAAVCRMLTDRGWPVVLVGSADDRAAHAAMLAGVATTAVSLAGETPALVLAGVLQQSACAVGVDTGPVHIAAALGTPCIAIFGSTDARRTAPCGDGHIILSAGLDCQPCLDQPCRRDGACMRLIAPAMVVHAVETTLRRADAR